MMGGRRGGTQSELFEANLDHAAHAALFAPPWRAAALRAGRAVMARLATWRRLPFVPVVALERLPQPLQLQDQGGALRADVARFAARMLQNFVMDAAIVSHDAAPSSEAARCTTFGAAAVFGAVTCWPAALTRANTSSRRPKAIALPS